MRKFDDLFDNIICSRQNLCTDFEIEAKFISATAKANEHYKNMTGKDKIEEHHKSLKEYFENKLKISAEHYKVLRENDQKLKE